MYDYLQPIETMQRISREELAEKLGVSRQSISLWENGQTMPTVENIVAIANIFDVSTDILLKDYSKNEDEGKINEVIYLTQKIGLGD